jgi:hypothetical protein
LKIDINIDDHEKTFTAPFVSGLVYRNYAQLSEEGKLTALTNEGRDKIVELIVEAFGNQFTADQFWKGVDAFEIDNVLINFCMDLQSQNKREGKLNSPKE